MHTPPLAVGLCSALFGLCAGLCGCAPATSQMTGAAVEGAVESVEESENLARINEIAESEAFQESVEKLGAAFTRGAAQGGYSEQVGATTEYVGAALARGLVHGARDTVGGMAGTQGIIDEAVSGVFAAAASERNRERAQLLVGDVTGAMVRSMTSSLAEGIEEDLRPAVDGASNGATPIIAKALADEDLRHALGGMVQEVSRQTTLGVDQAMAQIREQNRAQDEGVLGRMSIVGWAVLAALAVLLLGAIIAIIALAVSNRRRRHDREQVLTSMVAAYAVNDGDMDADTRAELLRHLGVEPRPTAKPSAPDSAGPEPHSGMVPAVE